MIAIVKNGITHKKRVVVGFCSCLDMADRCSTREVVHEYADPKHARNHEDLKNPRSVESTSQTSTLQGYDAMNGGDKWLE